MRGRGYALAAVTPPAETMRLDQEQEGSVSRDRGVTSTDIHCATR